MSKEVADDSVADSKINEDFKSEDKSSGSKFEKLEPEELVKKVQDYFFGNDDLAKLFEKYVHFLYPIMTCTFACILIIG